MFIKTSAKATANGKWQPCVAGKLIAGLAYDSPLEAITVARFIRDLRIEARYGSKPKIYSIKEQ